jgi:mono/diheme cytochrome c family protein
LGLTLTVAALGTWQTAAAQPAAEKPTGNTATASPSQQLYAAHCAGCHGPTGDGKGIAALFLYPKPRDFRRGKFRLVSTTNGAPTREDLRAVMLRGMPGSSMPSWAHLPQEDRELILDEVIRLYREGARDRYIASLKEQQLTDEEIQAEDVQAEIKEFVERQTTPDEIAAVPQLPDGAAAAIARGRELYIKQSCHSCHGLEGKGDGVQKMIDDEGFATRPRDLTRGIYKGGHDVASLYRRIYYGMPGTPMPASKNLTPEQAADMIHFLRSLSTEEQRESVVLKRGKIEAVRVARVPADGADAAWQSAPSAAVQTFPLWWRDDAEPNLTVQALHDGQTLALRIIWQDATLNDSDLRPEDFEDMAAVQLYEGKAEPFLGMGGDGGLIDLWQWRAATHADASAQSQLDDYPFDEPIYRELAEGKVPDFITARAAGNPLALREHEGSSLLAKGPGSLTFRPKPSQYVKAKADWKEGRWTVVLTRPLKVMPEAGLSLAAGQRYSVALAVWDGAARDRGPQKQVSIWHDLELR